MKELVRGACLLVAGLLGACGGGGMESGERTGDAPPAPETRLVLDNVAWDQGDWAD